MNQNISLTIDFVKKTLEGAEVGHDWFHTERVWRLAKFIAKTENCNQEIVEISALLHDIADPKFHNGDETLALEISEKFLNEIGMEAQKIEQILFIIKHISFKNKGETIEKTKELEIVFPDVAHQEFNRIYRHGKSNRHAQKQVKHLIPFECSAFNKKFDDFKKTCSKHNGYSQEK